MKKLLTVFVAVILLAVCAVSVNAAETGTCGDNLTWTLDGDTLTISGTGTMYDYSEESPAPWAQWNDTIKYIKIKRGVKSIGAYAFAEMNVLFKAYIPATVASIGSKAFSATDASANTIYFLGDIPAIAEDAFTGRKSGVGYLRSEDPEILQGYGGTLTWNKGRIYLNKNIKALYGLNEEIKKSDIVVLADFMNGLTVVTYVPKELVIGPYDNSTYGQKYVCITADGEVFGHDYFVTDGQNHLDLINADFPAAIGYSPTTNDVYPNVRAGSLPMQRWDDYDISFRTPKSGYREATITGKGIFEGYKKTFTYAVLRRNIADASVTVSNVTFQGLPVMPKVVVKVDEVALTAGKDYVLVYENNVNIGTGVVRVIGQGNYYGSVSKSFKITADMPTDRLIGNYIGEATGPLTGEPYYKEVILPPGKFEGRLDCYGRHVAYYELHRIVGEEAQLITTKETDYEYASKTKFEYDFTSIYEEESEEGGAIYVLSYLWVDGSNDVYSGACVMIIPAKVPDATSLVVEEVEGTGIYNRAYVTAYGPDGNVGTVEWTTADPSVATVNDKGVVSFKKPGSVAVTGKYGNLTDSVVVTAQAQDIRQGDILAYYPLSGTVSVFFDRYPLTAGTDYTLAAEERDGVVTVTVTGCGLFSGQLVREFDVATGEAVDHTHSFDNSCDGICNSCDFARSVVHDFAEAWSKNGTQHWHACTVCGEKADVEDHTLSSVDNTVCTVCGSLYTPGDLDNNGFVDNKDVEYLLWYTLFSEDYPLNQDADFDGNGQVDNKDVEYLLWHTLFSEDYPLVR